jgi:lysophospholipase L1-like esterase
MLRILVTVFAFLLTSVAMAQQLPVAAFGDSNTLGTGVTQAQAWPDLVASNLGVALTNNAVSGAQAADQSFLTYSTTPSASNDYLVSLGTNDAEVYGADSQKLAGYVSFLQDLIVYLAAPNRVTGRAMTLTGSGWGNTGSEPFGVQTSSAGATATATVSGTAVYVSYVVFNAADNNGTFTVAVDGVNQGTVNPNGTYIGNTQLGKQWSPGVTRFGGLSAGSHTVTVTQNSPGSLIFVDWIAGSNQASKPTVRVFDVIRRATAAYANGNSDANIANYNAAISTMVSNLATDGLNVSDIDIASIIDPAADLQSDGIHLNVTGHQIVASAVETAIGGPPAGTWSGALSIWQFTPTGGGAASYCLAASQPTSMTGSCPNPISIP